MFIFLPSELCPFLALCRKAMQCKAFPCTNAFVLKCSPDCVSGCSREALAWFCCGAVLSGNSDIWCSACVRTSSHKYITKSNNKTRFSQWHPPCSLCMQLTEAHSYDADTTTWKHVDLRSLNLQHVDRPPPAPSFLSNFPWNDAQPVASASPPPPPPLPFDLTICIQRIDGLENRQRELHQRCRTKDEKLAQMDEKIIFLMDLVETLTTRVTDVETTAVATSIHSPSQGSNANDHDGDSFSMLDLGQAHVP